MHTVTIKGQVTIPKGIREMLDIVPGSQVDFVVEGDGRVVLQKVEDANRPADRFDQLRGHAGQGLSTDQIMALTRGDAD